jgi:hypothetical protein
MPVYNTRCSKCWSKRRILTTCTSFDSIPIVEKVCPKCNYVLVRDASGPSTSVKEVLDNGAMPKAVERFADIEGTMAERNRNADENAGKKNWS